MFASFRFISPAYLRYDSLSIERFSDGHKSIDARLLRAVASDTACPLRRLDPKTGQAGPGSWMVRPANITPEGRRRRALQAALAKSSGQQQALRQSPGGRPWHVSGLHGRNLRKTKFHGPLGS